MRYSRKLSMILLFAGSALAQTRPVNLFVERVVTPDRSRQLRVALNAEMWILYDLPQCQLYQAWNGGTTGGSLKMADFGWFNQGAHFPHWYTTAGTNYFKEAVGEYFSSWTKTADIDLYYTKWKQQPRNYKAWTVSNGGAAVNARTRYRGFFVNGTVFKLSFGLVLPDGKEIAVTEVPEYSNAGGKPGLTRKFTVSGLPAGHSISLKLPSTGWTGAGVNGGTFTISANGDATLTGAW